MLKATVLDNETNQWPQLFKQIVDRYNDTYQRTIKMKPQDAWSKTFAIDFTTLPSEVRLEAIRVRKTIKENIEKAANDLKRDFDLKNLDYKERFAISQIVLVRVPKRYRGEKGMIQGRKAKLIAFNDHTSRWQLQWQETGGILRSEKAFEQSRVWYSVRDLKPFYLRDDINLEITLENSDTFEGTQILTQPLESEMIYDKEDYSDFEIQIEPNLESETIIVENLVPQIINSSQHIEPGNIFH